MRRTSYNKAVSNWRIQRKEKSGSFDGEKFKSTGQSAGRASSLALSRNFRTNQPRKRR
jgi:hypothetical protein